MQENLKKFRFRDLGVILYAPEAIEKAFVAMGFATTLDSNVKSSNTLVFINDHAAYTDFLKNTLQQIEPDSVLWFAYPKGSSKIKTDINRDILRLTGEQFGITTVTAISIDDTWSALRFRPIGKVGS
jgi:hypothetical protein